MNITIQVDSRTLREFYPEPELRHLVHYLFAHKFLPLSIHSDPYAFFNFIFSQAMSGRAMEPTLLIHGAWKLFEEKTELIKKESGSVFRRVSDLTMSIEDVAGWPVVLIQMPRPEKPPEAFFVAVALLSLAHTPDSWPRDVQARIFTLEAKYPEYQITDKHGMVCEWTKDVNHRNFGFSVLAEKDAFLGTVQALLLAPDTIADVTYAPHEEIKYKFFK